MLHVIAVDDESSALKWFTRVASENPELTIDGVFQYAEDAIAFVKEHAVDVAFLDIEMPEMDGTLWPELEPQKAMNLFRVTCTSIRSALSAIGFKHMTGHPKREPVWNQISRSFS